jgi:hypothetical protein
VIVALVFMTLNKKGGNAIFDFDNLLIAAGVVTVFVASYVVLVKIDAFLKYETLTLMLERRTRRKKRKLKDE